MFPTRETKGEARNRERMCPRSQRFPDIIITLLYTGYLALSISIDISISLPSPPAPVSRSGVSSIYQALSSLRTYRKLQILRDAFTVYDEPLSALFKDPLLGFRLGDIADIISAAHDRRASFMLISARTPEFLVNYNASPTPSLILKC